MTTMTKTNARAILAARRAILKALDTCASRLTGDDKVYFDAYWGAHVRSYVEGRGYGTAPIDQALEVTER
jgi:hypothetical protein